jgi:hypothetical protein
LGSRRASTTGNGLLAHYSLHVSKELGIGKAALRRIPCACDACLAQIELEWQRGIPAEQQPRFATNKSCQWWSIFAPRRLEADGSWTELEGAGLNDWIIVDLQEKKNSDPADEEAAHEEALAGMTKMMSESIHAAVEQAEESGAAVYGAFATLDEDADGYYLIKWSGKPYTLQDDVELTQYTPAIHIKAGEHVIDGEFMNKVPGAQLWYTPMEGEARKTVVRVKQVVAADLKLAPISDEDKLPSGMPKKNKKVTTEKKALHVGPDDHEIILDEIARREESEHEELEGAEDSEEEEDSDDDDEEKEGEDDA